MKIIIAGCGKVGTTIVEQLSLEGHEISVIDRSSEVIRSITNAYDVMGVVGNVASHEVQKDAGVEDADLLIAVTDSDEVNLLCCLVAKKSGCVTIARVRNPIYNKEIGFIKEELGLSMSINPEYAAATEIARLLRIPSAISVETFARGTIEVLEFKVPENNKLDGMKVMDVRKATQSDVLIAAVEREDEVIIPKGGYIIHEGDNIAIVAAPAESRRFFKNIGMTAQRVKNALIVGGGTIAYYLTKQLIASGIEVKIIDRDRNRCEQLADMLPEAVIINGDATDESVLLEEGVESCDSFISLTGIDEANIFYSMFAKGKSPDAKLITKVNKMSYENVLNEFDLGSVIYPKYMTAERIVRYVRAMQNGIESNVETLHRIVKNQVEALEFVVKQEPMITGIPLHEMELKDNLLVAAIIRMREIIYPKGSTTLEPGDRVIVVTIEKGLGDLKDILK